MPPTLLLLVAIGLSSCSSQAMEQTKPRTPYQLVDADIWGTSVLRGPVPEFQPDPPAPPILVDDWLIVEADELDRPAACRAVQERWLIEEQGVPPRAEQTIEGEGESAWKWTRLGEPTVPANRIACAYAEFRSHSEEVRMLRLTGASTAFLNGLPFAGDPERRGYRGVPVPVKEGWNRIFVFALEGELELELWEPATRIVINDWDPRVTSLGPDPSTWSFDTAEVALYNASREAAEGIHFHYSHAVPDDPTCRPVLNEWQDGGTIAPFAMITKYPCVDGLGGFTEAEEQALVRADGALLAVCAYSWVDLEAARAILRLPFGDDSPGIRIDEASPLARLDRTVYVYSSGGGREENELTLAQARYAQQLAWYRWHVIPRVESDQEVLDWEESSWERKRYTSRVLFGTPRTNLAWERYVRADARVRVAGEEVRVGKSHWNGPDVHARVEVDGDTWVVTYAGWRGARRGLFLDVIIPGESVGGRVLGADGMDVELPPP